MLFSSIRYFVFLTVLSLVLNCIRSRAVALGVLAVASCLFYASWDWHYLALLVTISVVDYWCASVIHHTEIPKVKKVALTASIVSNLAILGYFKYANFGVANLNGFLSLFGYPPLPHLNILLPAGISFYTFKAMSYTIDVYRKAILPCKSWMNYLTFITFFPELIAGPIVRASVFLPQLSKKATSDGSLA